MENEHKIVFDKSGLHIDGINMGTVLRNCTFTIMGNGYVEATFTVLMKADIEANTQLTPEN